MKTEITLVQRRRLEEIRSLCVQALAKVADLEHRAGVILDADTQHVRDHITDMCNGASVRRTMNRLGVTVKRT
jgi:hypothetical protein